MKTVEWQMKEDFVFPSSVGLPTGSETIKVTPRFTIARSEEAVRLTGIYHIAANIALNPEESRTEEVTNAILIDDVDVQNGKGYFEYAVPLHIDLPAEVKDPLQVAVKNVACEPNGQGFFAVSWEVKCSYGQGKVAKETNAEQVANAKEEASEKQVKAEKVQTAKVEAKQKEQTVKAEAREPEAQPFSAKEKRKSDTTNKKQSKEVAEQEVQAVTAEQASAAALAEQPDEPDVAPAIAQREEQAAEAQAEQVTETATAQADSEEERSAAVSVIEDTTFSESDDALSFLAELDDGVTSTMFRSNNVSV